MEEGVRDGKIQADDLSKTKGIRKKWLKDLRGRSYDEVCEILDEFDYVSKPKPKP